MLILNWNNPFTLQWVLADGTGHPILAAAVTATLYSGRSQLHPDRIAGTAVSAINNVSLTDQSKTVQITIPDGTIGNAEVYQAQIAAQTSPPPAAQGYFIMVFEARLSGVLLGHWEEQVQIVVNS